MSDGHIGNSKTPQARQLHGVHIVSTDQKFAVQVLHPRLVVRAQVPLPRLQLRTQVLAQVDASTASGKAKG
jgi:hypothetical protein